MTIARALKEKNRIAGKIKKLQNDIQKYNHTRDDRPSDYNSNELYEELQTQIKALIELKTKLANANIGILEKLIQLSEVKSAISFWSNFRTGQEFEPIKDSKYVNGEYVTVEISGGHTISNKVVQERIVSMQLFADSLQDDIDEYNAATKI
jgi:hypothetical protein